MQLESHTIAATDGYLLGATLFRPEKPNEHLILINGAMGVRQTFYHPFATYLRDAGFTVLTWDYRGLGQSLHGSLRRTETSLLQWGGDDQATIITWLKQQYSGYPLTIIGHSLGAQIAGMTPYIGDVHALVAISAQNPYWMNWSGLGKLRALLSWYIIVPLTSFIMRYFPANWLGLGDPMPRQIGYDWANASRQRNYLIDFVGAEDANHWAEFKGYLLSLSFQDDTLLSERAVIALLDFYPNSRVIDHQYLKPSAFDVAEIGHMGYFKSAMQASLWPKTVDWLLNPPELATPETESQKDHE